MCMSVNTYSIVWLYQISWTNGIVSFRTWQIPQCGSGSGMNLSLTNHKTLMQINQPYIVLYYITLHRTCVRTVWTALVNWSIDLGTFLQQIRIFIRVDRGFSTSRFFRLFSFSQAKFQNNVCSVCASAFAEYWNDQMNLRLPTHSKNALINVRF